MGFKALRSATDALIPDISLYLAVKPGSKFKIQTRDSLVPANRGVESSFAPR